VASEVLDAIREANPREDIVPLSCAFNSLKAYPTQRLNNLVREVIREHRLHAGELVLPPGDAELRRQIAKHMGLAGAATDPAHVVITNGAMDVITLSLGVLCQPGDSLLIESPTYFGRLQAIEHLRLKAFEVPNRLGEGIDVEAARNAVRTQQLSAALLMPNFNIPVGSRTPDDAKREHVNVLGKVGVPIIEDDIYGDLHYGSVRPTSLRAFDEAGWVTSCGSIAKTIALGFRLGWAVSPQFHADISRAKCFSSGGCPTLQQRVLARYYARGGYDRFLRDLRTEQATNAQRFVDAIARYFPRGTRVAQPAGGVVLWLELPVRVEGTKLFRSALASRIGISPSIVSSVKGEYRNYIRLGCGLSWSATIEKALKKLGKLAKALAD
jgi:DNA-binding transcriptional MocR family regulator